MESENANMDRAEGLLLAFLFDELCFVCVFIYIWGKNIAPAQSGSPSHQPSRREFQASLPLLIIHGNYWCLLGCSLEVIHQQFLQTFSFSWHFDLI